MRNICRDFITAIVILPFTAGNYQRRQNGSWYYDGTISSIVLFLVFLCTVGILTISKSIDIEKDKRLAVVFVLLTFIQVIGVFACVFLGVLVNKRGLDHVVHERQEKSVRRLQLIFLWIFGIGAGMCSGFFVGQQIQCGVFGTKVGHDGQFFWDSRGIFNVITVLFLLTEIIFISFFAQFQLKSFLPTVYVLFLLVCASVSIWLHSIIIDNEQFPESILEKHFGNTSNISLCLQNDSIGKLINTSKATLGACFLEFFLLSITILLEMWSSINTSADNLPVYQEHISSSTDDGISLLQDHSPENLSGSGRTVYHLVALVSSIGVGVAKIVRTIVWVKYSDDTRQEMQMFDTVMYSLMLGACMVGFYCLAHYCEPDRKSNSLKVSEYVYLSSAFGIIALHVCDILTGYLSNDRTSSSKTSSCIIALVQDYFQVVFLLQSNRCKKVNRDSKLHLLDGAFIFLLVTNFCIWVVDSFILPYFHSVTRVEQQVLGSVLWGLYHDILLPIGVFFRFSSALEIYTTFKEYGNHL